MDFLVRRDDLHACRFEDGDPPDPGEGEALLRVERFGLTSNNITYAVFGEAMSYWDFFPAPEGLGHLPVWGFAEVASSPDEGLPEGARLYGYLPLASHLIVRPGRVDERGFFDAAPHRAELPSAYQGYRRTDADPVYREDTEDEQILFWPLFYTSWLIDDLLDDESFFGAETIVISSASAKTSLIAAHLLAQREGIETVGLTSAGNAEFVEGLGVYDATVPYEEIESLPGERAVYVDVSGDGEIRARVHGHYGDRLAHSLTVGATHWDRMAQGSSDLPGPKPRFFFAPDRVKKRGEDWGTGELEQRVAGAWGPFAEWAGGWLEVERIGSEEEIKRVYLELLGGRIDPRVGHVVALDAASER